MTIWWGRETPPETARVTPGGFYWGRADQVQLMTLHSRQGQLVARRMYCRFMWACPREPLRRVCVCVCVLRIKDCWTVFDVLEAKTSPVKISVGRFSKLKRKHMTYRSDDDVEEIWDQMWLTWLTAVIHPSTSRWRVWVKVHGSCSKVCSSIFNFGSVYTRQKMFNFRIIDVTAAWKQANRSL